MTTTKTQAIVDFRIKVIRVGIIRVRSTRYLYTSQKSHIARY